MLKRHLLSNLIIFASLFTFYSCNQETQEDNVADEVAEEMVEDTEEKFKGVHGLPSPIQIASTIKKSGINYDASVLNPTDNASNYTNNFKKGLNVGVYGADLGYAAIYDQTQDAINYLNTVKSLADELGIIGAFEKNTLDEVQQNLGNQDKLLEIVTNAFFESDQYLQQHKRNKASALILAGGWVEGLYIACNMTKTQKNEQINTRIGEQKITLGILITLLNQFADDEEIAGLVKSINELKEIYDGVEIKYEYNESGMTTTDVSKKKSEIMTRSKVIISDEQLNKIASKIQSIRTQIVS